MRKMSKILAAWASCLGVFGVLTLLLFISAPGCGGSGDGTSANATYISNALAILQARGIQSSESDLEQLVRETQGTGYPTPQILAAYTTLRKNGMSHQEAAEGLTELLPSLNRLAK